MNTKRFLLAGCATIILSAGAAQAGSCDTAGKAASAKDAGSGPTVVIPDRRREPARMLVSTPRPAR